MGERLGTLPLPSAATTVVAVDCDEARLWDWAAGNDGVGTMEELDEVVADTIGAVVVVGVVVVVTAGAEVEG